MKPFNSPAPSPPPTRTRRKPNPNANPAAATSAAQAQAGDTKSGEDGGRRTESLRARHSVLSPHHSSRCSTCHILCALASRPQHLVVVSKPQRLQRVVFHTLPPPASFS